MASGAVRDFGVRMMDSGGGKEEGRKGKDELRQVRDEGRGGLKEHIITRRQCEGEEKT